MKMQLSELTTERKWRAATGLNEERFYKLLERFKEAYEAVYKKSIEQKQEAAILIFAFQMKENCYISPY